MRTSSAKTADLALSRSCARVPASESTHPAGQRLDRGVWTVASVSILGVVMSLLDTTIANVALATLGRDSHAPVATIQWVSAGYLVSLALAIPLAGWLVERFGTKRLWMLAVAGFGAGSALLRRGRIGRLADLRTRPAGARSGTDHAGGDDRDRPDGGARPDRPSDGGRRGADAARADPRAGARWPHRQQRLVEVDLLRQCSAHRGSADPRPLALATRPRLGRCRPIRLARILPASPRLAGVEIRGVRCGTLRRAAWRMPSPASPAIGRSRPVENPDPRGDHRIELQSDEQADRQVCVDQARQRRERI